MSAEVVPVLFVCCQIITSTRNQDETKVLRASVVYATLQSALIVSHLFHSFPCYYMTQGKAEPEKGRGRDETEINTEEVPLIPPRQMVMAS